MGWEKGRQNTGYEKLLLLIGKWPKPFDVYLIRFKEGSEIPPHVDEVESGEHHRLNIILKHAKIGGEFECQDLTFGNSRIKYFRPDYAKHSVTKVIKGTRYILSIGWINE